MHLRGLAIELGQQYTNETSTRDAIIEIAKSLAKEGLNKMPNCKLKDIIEDQREKHYEEEDEALLQAYHYLIWNTAGAAGQQCTLPRACGESAISPFLPAILEATQMRVEAETVIRGESIDLHRRRQHMDSDMSTYLQEPEGWKEIGVLEFFNSSLPPEKRLKAMRSRPIVQVITSRTKTLTWKEAQDSDEHKGEEIFITPMGKQYVRSDGDVRKLFEVRPPLMGRMPLGQFASEFRLVHPSDHGYENAKSTIDEGSLLGPATEQKVAGTTDVFLPNCMELLNTGILTRRKEKAAILQLYEGTCTKYSSHLLWTPWLTLEEVNGADQEALETDQQRTNRLFVFPMSILKEEVEEHN